MPFLSTSHGQVQVHQHAPPAPRTSAPKISVFTAFNIHAQSCSRCRMPLEVVRRGEQLCDEGHNIAISVARALYKIAGEKANQYGTENFHVDLLIDFAGVDGPVYDLCRAIDQGLNRSAAPKEPTNAVNVHYIRPKSSHEPRESHYGSSPSSYSRHYTATTSSSSSSSRPRRESRDDTPRRSGNIRVNIPVEFGREASYYEEFSHSNGGRVTTKYYHTEAPRPLLTRANTVTEVAKPRRSTVHFDPEVKYYT